MTCSPEIVARAMEIIGGQIDAEDGVPQAACNQAAKLIRDQSQAIRELVSLFENSCLHCLSDKQWQMIESAKNLIS